MKRMYWILPGVLLLAAGIAFGVHAYMERFTIRVRNDTDGSIFVHGTKKDWDLNYGGTNIGAHSEGRLHTGVIGYPNGITVGSYEYQWWFACNWGDAKAHEPVVVTVTMTPGENGYRRVTPSANCTITAVQVGLAAPTPDSAPVLYQSPVPAQPAGAAPLQLPGNLTPAPRH